MAAGRRLFKADGPEVFRHRGSKTKRGRM